MTWYTWLEQGRDINVSKQVLESIGRALQLNADEYMHMLHLARVSVPTTVPNSQQSISTALQKIVDDLAYPAMVVNNRADVLVWNAVASRYFIDFSTMPDNERNMTWQLCTNKSLLSRIVLFVCTPCGEAED
jgi:hypothetical protein